MLQACEAVTGYTKDDVMLTVKLSKQERDDLQAKSMVMRHDKYSTQCCQMDLLGPQNLFSWPKMEIC